MTAFYKVGRILTCTEHLLTNDSVPNVQKNGENELVFLTLHIRSSGASECTAIYPIFFPWFHFHCLFVGCSIVILRLVDRCRLRTAFRLSRPYESSPRTVLSNFGGHHFISTLLTHESRDPSFTSICRHDHSVARGLSFRVSISRPSYISAIKCCILAHSFRCPSTKDGCISLLYIDSYNTMT
jgi:hypothetical protein